jgi:hypothetical protein
MALVISLGWGGSIGAIHAQETPERPSAGTSVRTLAQETYAIHGYNYCNRMVDKDGLPYFDIFWTEPAEAVHDWPDFGDVMSRPYQGVVMARHMKGVTAPIEAIW